MGLIKKLDSQNVNKVVKTSNKQLNKKKSKEIIPNKTVKLNVNQNLDINPETIKELPNNLQLE